MKLLECFFTLYEEIYILALCLSDTRTYSFNLYQWHSTIAHQPETHQILERNKKLLTQQMSSNISRTDHFDYPLNLFWICCSLYLWPSGVEWGSVWHSHGAAGASLCCGHCCPTHTYTRHLWGAALLIRCRKGKDMFWCEQLQPNFYHLLFYLELVFAFFFLPLITDFFFQSHQLKVIAEQANIGFYYSVTRVTMSHEQSCQSLGVPKGQHEYTKQVHCKYWTDVLAENPAQ